MHPEPEKTAKQIAHAVNCFGQLVEALEAVVESERFYDFIRNDPVLYDMVLAALDTAKAKPT